MKKKAFFILLFIGFLFVCYRIVTRPRVVRVGLLVNLSGPGGKAGRYIRDGFLFGIGEMAKKGCPVEFEVFIGDYNESDELLKRKIDELYKEGVRIFVGPVTSHACVVAERYAEEAGKDLVFITPYAATTELSNREDMFVRTSVDNALFVKAFLRWVHREGVERIGVVMDVTNPDFVYDILGLLKTTGLRLSAVEISSKSFTGPEDVARKLLMCEPDAVLFLTKTRETVILAQKLRSSGYKGRFAATIWSQTPELLKWGKDYVEGLVIISFVKSRYDNPRYKSFAEAFEKVAGYPLNARSMRTIEVVEILCRTLERSCAKDPRDVLRNLVGRRYTTLMGNVFINRWGDAVRPVYEIEVKGGSFTTLKPILNES